jgi:hypothetical protein
MQEEKGHPPQGSVFMSDWCGLEGSNLRREWSAITNAFIYLKILYLRR